MKKKIKGHEVDVTEVVNQAIKFAKSVPCAVCSLEGACGIKYKETCPIWRKLKIAFIEVMEIEE